MSCTSHAARLSPALASSSAARPGPEAQAPHELNAVRKRGIIGRVFVYDGKRRFGGSFVAVKRA
jgi:hypothetical protein